MNHSLFFKISIVISGMLMCSVVEALAGDIDATSTTPPYGFEQNR